jgi:hypothetical protein
MISGRGTNTELSTEEISLAWATHGPIGSCPDVEAVGHRSSCSRWIVTDTGTPLAGLNGGLLLLLLLLLLQLLDLLSEHFSLKVLCLHRLKSHYLELHHLHLHLRGWHVEGHAKGVHPMRRSLLGSKTVVGTIDGGGGWKVPVIIDVPLGHLAELITFVLL